MRAWPMDTPFNVADLSMQPPASFPELYAPLWLYSGGNANQNHTTAGYYFLTKGASGSGEQASIMSSTELHTLNANWPANTRFALEVAIYCASSSGIAYAELWDMTTNTAVSGSQISTSATSFTVIRSSTFTLIPGHQYGVTMYNSSASYSVYLTDASLIIFPPAGSVSPSLSSISLANPSGGSLKEAYYPLWVYSSGSISTTSSASGGLIPKGATNALYSYSDSRVQLHTLNANWSAGQKFALEASIWAQSSGTCYAELWDCTTNTAVAGTQVSTTATTATLIRSGSVTLNPSHKYGVSIWSSSNTYSAYLTKAHLVALGG